MPIFTNSGSQTLNIVSVTKNYSEQRVIVINGGPHSTSTITVKSANPNEQDKVYTLISSVSPADAASLLDIKVDGVSIPQFRPNIYSYVVSVTTDETPDVTYTEQMGAVVEETASTAKYIVLKVTAGTLTHSYRVTFFYANDISFDPYFENWQTMTHPQENREGSYPTGWNATINATTSYNGSTLLKYYPEANLEATTEHTEGTKGAQLRTYYIARSAESMPGILSLSPLTITVGHWSGPKPSSIAFGDPRLFRNTPDQIQLDYRLEATNKVTGWQFLYDANHGKQIDYHQNFSELQLHQWNTFTQNLTYAADYIPDSLDIRIISAETLNTNTYYVYAGGAVESNQYSSTMYFDNLNSFFF